MAAFHPLAVAHVLCDADRYREFARQILQDGLHPLRPVCQHPAAEAAATAEWFRQRSLAAIEAFLRYTGVDPQALLEGEPPLNETVRSYCPRCRCQFVLESGNCSACGGIPLEPFPPARGPA